MQRKKVKTKVVKTKSKEQEIRHQYTVVLEDIRSQFRVFGEGLDYISDKLDEQGRDLKEVKERLITTELRLARVETELEFVKEQLGIIRHNQVTRDEFKLLETRVARLEQARR